MTRQEIAEILNALSTKANLLEDVSSGLDVLLSTAMKPEAADSVCSVLRGLCDLKLSHHNPGEAIIEAFDVLETLARQVERKET